MFGLPVTLPSASHIGPGACRRMSTKLGHSHDLFTRTSQLFFPSKSLSPFSSSIYPSSFSCFNSFPVILSLASIFNQENFISSNYLSLLSIVSLIHFTLYFSFSAYSFQSHLPNYYSSSKFILVTNISFIQLKENPFHI